MSEIVKDDFISKPLLGFNIRSQIFADEQIWSKLAKLNSFPDILSTLKECFCDKYSEPYLEEVLAEIAIETIKLRNDPSLYLISANGGESIKLTPDMIVTPTVKMEDGTEKTLSPRLHPKVISNIVISAQENSKISRLEKEYPNSPALKHIRDPWHIIDVANRYIDSHSQMMLLSDSEECESHTLEVGREPMNYLYHSFNPKFIRSELYGEFLAKKILAFNKSRYKIFDIVRKRNYSDSWYEVTVVLNA